MRIHEIVILSKKASKAALLKEPTIQYWLEQVKANSRRGLSGKTQDSYLSGMRQFVDFLSHKKEIDETLTFETLIEEGQQSRNGSKIKNYLLDFGNWLTGNNIADYKPRKKTISFNSSLTFVHGIMRGFFRYNGVNFGKWSVPQTETTEVKKSDRKEENQLVKNKQLDRTKVRAFANRLNFRDRVILSTKLAAGGHDLIDLLELKIEDLDVRHENRIVWDGNRQKTGMRFLCFIGKQATELLDEFVKNWRKGAKSSDYVFVPFRLNGKKSYERTARFGNEDEPTEIEVISKSEKLTPETVAQAFREATLNLGLKTLNSQSAYRPKRFRRIFRTLCREAGVNQLATKIFMGHALNISESYDEMPIEDLFEEYTKVEPLLEIYKSSVAYKQDEDILTLKQSYDKLQKDMEELKQFKEEALKLFADLKDVRAYRRSVEEQQDLGTDGKFVVDFNLFVYGTLMTGESNHHCLRDYKPIKATLKGYRKDGLNIIEDPNSEVMGEMYQFLKYDDLVKIDQLEGEGDFYKRIQIQVIRHDTRQKVYAMAYQIIK